MKKEQLSDDKKLRYLQMKIQEAILKCINIYSLSGPKETLFHTFLNLVFMRFRDSIDTSVAEPARLKSLQSVVDNVSKESLRKIMKCLPRNYTLDDIDALVPQIVQSVCKDYLGATIVFHTKNNCNTYCEQSTDPYVKKLYKAVLSTEEYIRSEKKGSPNTLAAKLYKHFQKIDISATFLDDFANQTVPKKVKPLDLEHIDTLEKYYETKISLLTLLSNLSMPCTESVDGKEHKYCVSEIDVPLLQLVKQTMELNPNSKDEAIKILLDLAKKNYFKEYLPFDEQLDALLKEKDEAKQSSSYTSKLSSKSQKNYTQELNNLLNNLKQLKNDRLLNYILKIELPKIFEKLSEEPNLDVEILSHKERAKSSGFYACYYIVKLNGIVVGEVLGNSEFRFNLSKEGNASHNTMNKKSTNIKPLFELKAFPFSNSKRAKEKLDLYSDFLSIVSLNDVSGYHVSNEDLPALNYLKDLVNYASSKLNIKEKIEIKNRDTTYFMDFFDYITLLLDAKGAKYTTMYPAHIVEHNQSISVPQSPLYSLENILKSRIGFSYLAHMVREKYVSIATIKNQDKLSASAPVRSYSSTLTPKYDLPIDTLAAKKAEEDYVPFDRKFYPMGQAPCENER